MERANQRRVTGTLAARQAALFVALTWAQTLAIALALPHAGIAPLIAIVTPTIAAVLVITITTPRAVRREAWATVGFRRPGWRAVLIAVAAPAAITLLSFGGAIAVGVARLSTLNLSPDAVGRVALDLVFSVALFAIVFLGEEIGWRGYLLPRLTEVMSGRWASVVTGACHAIFHLPLLVLTTTYQSAGDRSIVVPMVMGTLTLAGVVYGWLRMWAGSIWPVSLAHSAFNIFMEQMERAVVPTSPAALAYVTTETGVCTLALMVVFAGWLLTRRAADFAIRISSKAVQPAS